MTDQITETKSITATTQPATTVVIHPQDTTYSHIVTGTSVEASPVPDDMNDRVRQQTVIPNAIKGRLMQPVQDDGGVILSLSVALPNTKSVTATVTSTSTNGGMIMSEVYWQLYWGQKDADHRLPQATDPALFPFYAFNPIYDRNGNGIHKQPGKTLSSMTVRNSSGSSNSIIIFFEAYIRMVINGSSSSTG